METKVDHIMSERYQIMRFREGVHDYSNISYIHIPKCGSTAIRQTLEDLNCSHSYKIGYGPAAPDENLFTVIRNPLDRWISGYLQYVYINNNSDQPYSKAQDGELVFDEHTLPMSEFLKGFGTNIKYFKFSTNVIAEINSYYDLELNSNIVNVTPKPDEVVFAPRNLVNSSGFQLAFNRIYAEDIKLWNNIEQKLDLCV